LNSKNTIRIKVLGISGSPRKNGNTEFLLQHALDAAKAVNPVGIETELYSFAKKTFLPCTSCYRCQKLGYCVLEDKDDFAELRDKWKEADAVVMATPVYHMGISGQLKCFIDRLGNSVDSPYTTYQKWFKVYGAIAQGAHIFSGQEHALTEIINHALIMGCIMVSGDAWEAYIGGGGWTEGTGKKNALKKLYEQGSFNAEAAVNASKSVGRRVAELSLFLKAGVLAHTNYLEKDPAFELLLERMRKNEMV